MFTGIVVAQGEIRRARRRGGLLELEIDAPDLAKELREGDSISVNGVCLTATSTARKRFVVEAMPETMALSTLGSLERGHRVNLELPVKVSDRLGGHLVQGHVDGVATVTRIQDEDGAKRIWLAAAAEILDYLARKGSITLDGVSLTITEVGRRTFQVALIPHTLEATTLGDLRVDSRLNVEVDVVAKYVKTFLERS